MASRDLVFSKRTRTLQLDLTRLRNHEGKSPDTEDVVMLLRDVVGLERAVVEGVQVHKETGYGFVKFYNEEKLEAIQQRFREGVYWPSMSATVYGWRTDTSLKVVTVFNASFELPLEEIKIEMERFGVVRRIEPNREKEWGCLDGTVTVWMEVKGGVRIPAWIHRKESVWTNFEVWRLSYRGQGRIGCWRCFEFGHIGRQCVTVEKQRRQEERRRQEEHRRLIKEAEGAREAGEMETEETGEEEEKGEKRARSSDGDDEVFQATKEGRFEEVEKGDEEVEEEDVGKGGGAVQEREGEDIEDSTPPERKEVEKEDGDIGGGGDGDPVIGEAGGDGGGGEVSGLPVARGGVGSLALTPGPCKFVIMTPPVGAVAEGGEENKEGDSKVGEEVEKDHVEYREKILKRDEEVFLLKECEDFVKMIVEKEGLEHGSEEVQTSIWRWWQRYLVEARENKIQDPYSYIRKNICEERLALAWEELKDIVQKQYDYEIILFEEGGRLMVTRADKKVLAAKDGRKMDN